ncbi:hypothetical protein B5G03_08080 [Gemmiger sp. An50]|nr:hypothetical protein B5G03_08080 [Gemmiger sp. An50]
MESWKNTRFQAKSHGTEKSEGTGDGQDISLASLNGFVVKRIFHDTAKRLCQRAYRLRFLSSKFRRIFDDDGTQRDQGTDCPGRIHHAGGS